MTETEIKAAELVQTYDDLLRFRITDESRRKMEAKQCALIAVDLMQKEYAFLNITREATGEYPLVVRPHYWQSVRAAIEKL